MRTSSDGLLVLFLKGGAAVFQFLLLVLTARWFGVTFRGEIALFGAAVNLVVLVVGFTGGISIVYLAARDPDRETLRRLLETSYAFCLLVPAGVALGSQGLRVSLGPHLPQLLCVATLNAMLVVHMSVLLAGQAVWQATLLEFLRPFSIVVLAIAVLVTRGFHEPSEFYLVWVIAAGAAWLLSLPLVVAHYRRLPARVSGEAPKRAAILRDLLTCGSLAQTSNVVQFLNYRCLFFSLERHAGLAAVGLFSTAVSFAEVLWIPTSSLAAMALNRVSRAPTEPATRDHVLRLSRLALVASVLAAALSMLIPVEMVTRLLGKDFAGVRGILLRLLPGVVAMGAAAIAGSYHAGRGRYVRNLVAASVGLALTLMGFAVWIPRFGVDGAVLAMNLSYAATATVLLAVFVRRERAGLHDFLPRRGDLAGLFPGWR